MCTSTCSRSYHVPLCSHGYDLVRESATRPKYAVLIHGRLQCKVKCCLKVTVVDIDTMTFLPKRACVKAHRFPPGSALCCGEFERDCPFLFVSGGNGAHAKTIHFYDVLLEEWHKLTELRTPRSDHKMHCVDKQLYVIGGVSAGLIEMYDLVKGSKTDKIKKGRPMAVRGCLNVKVHDFPSAVLDGRIYVFGGISDSGPVKCVQYFNTATISGVVAQLQDLPCVCHGGVAVVLANQIYIATEQGRLIKFDPVSKVSVLRADQPFRRTNFTLVVRNNKLHLFGGNACDGSQLDSPSDFVYNPCTDLWSVLDTNKPSLVVSASCIVEYSRSKLFTPFYRDLYSSFPHRCKHAKL